MLTAGTRLGPYEVTAQIGEGGMGQVYRATDTTLGRQVAIKILPDAFASDPERLARFEREAKTLAALNHPNIAAIYAVEAGPAVEGPAEAGRHRMRALVMELVEGEDLSQRIARGAIPLDEALPIAKQIADALEAAHEQGIIHRDLKPANIKVRADGTVKVLDFGLAKAMGPAEAGHHGSMGEDVRGVRLQPDLTHSPTMMSPALMSGVGVILGTAAYMAPEQAKGRTVDKRADIWAFGCVLYEMLTGTRAFGGDDVQDTFVAIMRDEPDWARLPATLSPALATYLKRCFQKDARQRVQAIGDMRLALEGAFETTAPQTTASATVAAPRGRLAWASAALLVGAVVAAIGTWALTRPPTAKVQPMRFALVPAAAQALAVQGFDRDLVLSADGTHIVYVAGSDAQLMVRAIDQLDATPLRGTTGARHPFLSPDGRWVGFFTGAGGEMRKVSIAGGPALPLCPIVQGPRGASWGPDDTIVFATNDTSTGLLRVSAAGGEPKVLTTPDTARGEADHVFPSVLPNGRAVLFTITASGASETAQVAVLDLTTGHYKTLIHGGSQAEYVDPGYLVYAVAGTLRAVRFDPAKLEVVSDPVPVVESVTTLEDGAAEFSISRTGALVYVPGGATGVTRSLVWVTRQGHENPIAAAPPRAYAHPRLSPDGTRVAVDIADQQNDIWIWDLTRQTLARLTDAPALDQYPVWTPDSRRIIFGSARAGATNLFWQAADNTGTVERLTTSPNTQVPTSISPDGTRLIVRETVPKTGFDLRVLAIDPSAPLGVSRATPPGTGRSATAPGASPRQTEPLVQTTFVEDNGELSPDGRWLAYQSGESGRPQISVRPFPNVDSGHWTISTTGGTKPLWARSVKELYYLALDGVMMAVPIQGTPAFSAGNPTKLFDTRYYAAGNARTYDVSRDGQKFLMIKDAGGDPASTPTGIVVVLNWTEELKARVPTK
jgi:serine/threonine-protein kinase